MNEEPNPFRVKGIARGGEFFDREEEPDQLVSRATGGQHTLILAPRRLGKSSLLERAASQLRKRMTVATVDLFKCATLTEFVDAVGREIVRSQEGALSKALAYLRKGLPGLAPKVSVNALGEPEFSVGIQPAETTLRNLDEILAWFDAHRGKRRKLLILDEIQELRGYDPTGRIEKALRASVQKLANTTVFYSGSLPSVLKEMFFERNRAFFQSAIRFDLGFAPVEEARAYLDGRFRASGKEVPQRFVADLAELSQGHPYYVQLLGYFAWELFREARGWTAFDARRVAESVFREERTAFESAISLLTPQQRQVYRAICREPRQPITASEFMRRHRLPAHSSVRKAALKLEELGFVIRGEDGFFPSDPLLARWWAVA